MLAGAIALGEATEAERDAYRRHLAVCPPCIAALGGEREIERTMATVAAARDGEVWEPDLRAALRRASPAGRRAWRFAAAVLGVAVLAAAVRVAAVRDAQPVTTVAFRPVAAAAAVHHPAPPPRRQARKPVAVAVAPVPATRMVVVHNVVTLKPPAAAHQPAAPPSRRSAAPSRQASVPSQREVASLAPSESDRQAVAALRTGQTASPEQRAESLAVAPQVLVVRDVAPLGGESALVPWLPAIAYSENAQGTTAFEVSVDEHGVPVKCTITKASGYLVLDESVCRAAMRARYSPRTVNGRPVPGSYRDAFTFRSGDDQ